MLYQKDVQLNAKINQKHRIESLIHYLQIYFTRTVNTVLAGQWVPIIVKNGRPLVVISVEQQWRLKEETVAVLQGVRRGELLHRVSRVLLTLSPNFPEVHHAGALYSCENVFSLASQISVQLLNPPLS